MSTFSVSYAFPFRAPTTRDVPLARRLALAHKVHRLVEAGEIDSYSEAAERFGITRANMTHLTNLMLLAPEIQASIVRGDCVATARQLRTVCKSVLWSEQQSQLG